MIKFFLSVIIFLHGAVHIWYILLLNNIVKYTPDMGWTGKSWLLPDGSPARITGTIIYIAAALLFIISGAGIMLSKAWYPALLISSAAISSVSILLFFDGEFNMLVQKGLIGFAINLIIIGYMIQV